MPLQNFAAPCQDFPDAMPPQNFAAPRADFFAQESKPDGMPLQDFAAQRQDFFVEVPKPDGMPLQNFSALQRQNFPALKSRTETGNVYVPLAETGWQQNFDARTLPGIVYETKDQNLPPVGPMETLASFWRGPET